jgi:predicted carbohydrate-binding protein with CBM5 and CBM33 domain
MASKGGNKARATASVLTCHANGQDFAVLEGSGVARAGERIPFEGQSANAAMVLEAFVSLAPRDGRYASGRNSRVAVLCRHSWSVGQPDRLGTL